jgi:hypothetical protein
VLRVFDPELRRDALPVVGAYFSSRSLRKAKHRSYLVDPLTKSGSQRRHIN